MKSNPDVLLLVLSLFVGGVLGLLSTLVINFIRQRQTITLRLLEEYFEVRKEIVAAVSALTTLDLHLELSKSQREDYRDSISRLFYQHYDFLARPVLESLLLLHMCLADFSGRLYNIRDGFVLPLEEEATEQFVERCSLFQNSRLFSPLALRSKSATVRSNEAINLHARYVLRTLNEFMAISDLLAMTKVLKKEKSK